LARRVLCWRRYTLNQIHFHSGSETTLGGRRYDMEAHLVHYEGGAAAKGAALVVGVFLTVVDDAAAADVRADSLASLPADAYAGFVAPHVARGATFFAYAGSMTTPPCASGVQWVSFERPLTITRRFLARFGNDVGPARADGVAPQAVACALPGGNTLCSFRSTQPSGGRVISKGRYGSGDDDSSAAEGSGAPRLAAPNPADMPPRQGASGSASVIVICIGSGLLVVMAGLMALRNHSHRWTIRLPSPRSMKMMIVN
jgi:hypothetical protein